MAKISLAVAALVVFLDQYTKYLISHTVKLRGDISLIGDIYVLKYVENRGAALGILSDHRWVFISVTSLAIAAFIVYIFITKIKSPFFITAAGLIIGGGIGNLIDRIYLGYVIDFLSLSFFPPVCNLADYAVSAGTVMLLIYIAFIYKGTEKTKKAESHEEV